MHCVFPKNRHIAYYRCVDIHRIDPKYIYGFGFFQHRKHFLSLQRPKSANNGKKVLQTSGLKNGFHNAHLYMHPYILALINDGLI
jgi:hypothetical protein